MIGLADALSCDNIPAKLASLDDFMGKQQLVLDDMRCDVHQLTERVANLEHIAQVPLTSHWQTQQLVQEVHQCTLQPKPEQCLQAQGTPQLGEDHCRCTNVVTATVDADDMKFEYALAEGTASHIEHRIFELTTLIRHVQDALIDLMEDVQEVDSKFGRFVATMNEEHIDSDRAVHHSLKQLVTRVAALEQSVQKHQSQSRGNLLDSALVVPGHGCSDSGGCSQHLTGRGALNKIRSKSAQLACPANAAVASASMGTFFSDIERRLTLQLETLSSLHCDGQGTSCASV